MTRFLARENVSSQAAVCWHLSEKWSRYRLDVAQKAGRSIALLFHDRGTRRGWVVSSTPRPKFTPGKDPVPILQEAGWAPGSVGRAENLVPTGFRSRTVQPVVSRYTEWATRPTLKSEWPTQYHVVAKILRVHLEHCEGLPALQSKNRSCWRNGKSWVVFQEVQRFCSS